jgi:hypothetical protein
MLVNAHAPATEVCKVLAPIIIEVPRACVLFPWQSIITCESTCCSAYSEDLRWRIVWQTEALHYTGKQVASNLGIPDKLTVNRIRHR